MLKNVLKTSKYQYSLTVRAPPTGNRKLYVLHFDALLLDHIHLKCGQKSLKILIMHYGEDC